MICPCAAVLIPFAHSVSAFYDVSVFLELISVLVGEDWIWAMSLHTPFTNGGRFCISRAVMKVTKA